MRETKHFVNDGFGWTCKRCRESAAGSPEARTPDALPRFFREGEAEEDAGALSSPATAHWKDETRRTLVCPLCGGEEDLAA